MKTLEKIRNFLVTILPLVLYFSYFPVIKIAETDSMHIELSLPLIWLGIFSVISLVLWTREKCLKDHTSSSLETPAHVLRDRLFSSNPLSKTKVLALLFPIFATISVIWSKNRLRGLLTSAIIWCLYVSIFSLLDIFRKKDENSRKIRHLFWKNLKLSTALVCLFCILQCILDTIGVPREKTLLCLGCTSTYFGFPHQNGFAIEPQFMGNLLLVPLILACNSLLENKIRKSQVIYTILVSVTLFLTFSRGTIYAFLAALVILIFAHRFDWRRNLKLIGLICCSFILSLGMQVVFAEKNVNYYASPRETISKAFDQLTLGRLKLNNKTTQMVNSPSIDPINTQVSASMSTSDSGHIAVNSQLTNNVPVFNGYVAESTNRRLELSKYALDIWNDSLKNILLGTGLGSSGVAMLEKFPSQGTSKEIVQNQYLETLLETGIIGSILLLLSIFEILKMNQISTPLSPKSYQIAILVAFAVSLCFFSGLPNALHIYLLSALV